MGATSDGALGHRVQQSKLASYTCGFTARRVPPHSAAVGVDLRAGMDELFSLLAHASLASIRTSIWHLHQPACHAITLAPQLYDSAPAAYHVCMHHERRRFLKDKCITSLLYAV
eukprot:SAG11_NODE_1055_length_6017_cov_1.548496_9_plen_114_part_00